jgi:hypothetical protein
MFNRKKEKVSASDNDDALLSSAEKQEGISSDQVADLFSEINISPELKKTVRLLLLSEQNNIISAVLKKLNGDKTMWEKARKEPTLLLKLIAHEQEESMYELQRAIGAREERERKKGREGEKKDNDGD